MNANIVKRYQNMNVNMIKIKNVKKFHNIVLKVTF